MLNETMCKSCATRGTRAESRQLMILYGLRQITPFILANKLRSAAPQAREVLVSAARTESESVLLGKK